MQQEFTELSEFRETDKSVKLNSAQFKDPFSHMCLSGLLNLGGRFEAFYCNDKYFSVNSTKTFRENLITWSSTKVRWIKITT